MSIETKNIKIILNKLPMIMVMCFENFFLKTHHADGCYISGHVIFFEDKYHYFIYSMIVDYLTRKGHKMFNKTSYYIQHKLSYRFVYRILTLSPTFRIKQTAHCINTSTIQFLRFQQPVLDEKEKRKLPKLGKQLTKAVVLEVQRAKK